MKVCIVGGVAGGATAAARMRRLNEQADILMFERGNYISFANCGLPYHISGTIQSREALLVQTPEAFHARYRIDVRTGNEVISIDRANKKIKVRRVATGEFYEETYDKLLLSPGASPSIPPLEKDADAQLFTLRDIPDLDRIMAHLKDLPQQKALVIGGGFIGIEVAENLQERGIETHLVELGPQLLAPLDYEMASIIHSEMKSKGIQLHLGAAVKHLHRSSAELSNGETLDFGICISAVGVKPEAGLAREAALSLGETGGILVDACMRTSDPDIFAVGDAVEVENSVTHKKGLVPLAGPANRQGRIAADNIMGLRSRYHDTQGTGILKIFDLTAAFTGISEKAAKRLGMNYEVIQLHPYHHASYYPGASQIHLKVLFEKESGRLLGAQAVGTQGVDKRIDVLATAIRASLTIEDLEHLELSYAPPYGSAKDPVNVAGYIGSNIQSGLVNSITYDRISEINNHLVVNVCEPDEWKPEIPPIPGSINVPLPKLRDSLEVLPKDRPLVVTCYAGLRGYLACRILSQSGFDHVYNLSGGYISYCHYIGH